MLAYSIEYIEASKHAHNTGYIEGSVPVQKIGM
jgi:hypothetical protein